MSKKVLILIRHAHRSKKQGREIDNGLSAKGHKQALQLKKHFKKAYPKAHPLVVTSPKLRCIETIIPIAGNKKDSFSIMPLLDEGGSINKKVKEFVQWWRHKAPELTVACSHGDWIPACVEFLTGANVELEKGAWAEIEMAGDSPKLTWLVQEP